MSQIGIAINACGWVATEHAKAILRNPHTYLVGVTSRRRESAERLVSQLGVDCRIYPDYEALLGDDDVDAVAVTTPNYLHTPNAIDACRAGKHVILEKPVAISHEQCDDLRRAISEAGITGVVSFVLRWNPLVLNIRRLIDSGAIGEVFFAQTDYWHGAGSVISPDRWISQKQYTGSAMLAGGSHAVDMMRFLMGREPVQAAAFSRGGLEGFDFDTTDNSMQLRSVHPGVTVDEVVAATGFELVIPGEVPESRLPTDEELRLIREVIDPKGLREREVPNP